MTNTYEQQLKEIQNPKGCGKIQQAKKETLLICAKERLSNLKWRIDLIRRKKEDYSQKYSETIKEISQLQEAIKKVEEKK